MPKETYMWEITEAAREKRCVMEVPTLTLLNTAGTWKGELPVQQTTAKKPCLMSPVPSTVTSPKALRDCSRQRPRTPESWPHSRQRLVPLQRAPPNMCPHLYPNTVNVSSHTKHLPPPFYSLFSLFIFKISNNHAIWYSRISHLKQQRTFTKEKKEHGKGGVTQSLFIREPLVKRLSAEPLPHVLPGINQRHTWHQGNLQGVGSSQPPGREIWNDRSWEVGQRLYICCTSTNTSKNLRKSVL